MKVALLLDDFPDKTTATGKTAHKIRSFNIAFVIKVCVGLPSRFYQTDREYHRLLFHTHLLIIFMQHRIRILLSFFCLFVFFQFFFLFSFMILLSSFSCCLILSFSFFFLSSPFFIIGCWLKCWPWMRK